MKYRSFGKTGKSVSALGFGTMRFPTSTNRQQDVIEKDSIKLLRRAVDAGINYFDTAYAYHGGRSETVLGKALSKGYRDKVFIADKFPSWLLKERSDFNRILAEQLKRLKTDRIDFYLMHALNKHYWENIKKTGILIDAEKAKQDGLIGHIGFSFHDDLETFQKIIDEYPEWEFCQIQYNYMDVDTQAGTAGLEYAAGKDLGLVIMEPLRGGQLTSAAPEPVAQAWESLPNPGSGAERALRFIWDRQEVSVVLSGMSSMEQLEENITLAEASQSCVLSEEERKMYTRVKELYSSLQPIPCTQCKYCQPCPQKVRIPDILTLYNESIMYNSLQESQRQYNFVIQAKNRADRCVECGQCEDICPQHISIISWLKKTHKALHFPK
ncbi:MAG: aldo/keto reductase [Spirochaetales bacterium]|nr:aldo/keto reductase [Spirochaetales bacterium]